MSVFGLCLSYIKDGVGHLWGRDSDTRLEMLGQWRWARLGTMWVLSGRGKGARGTEGRRRNKTMLSWNAAKRNCVGGKSRPTMVHFHKMWWHFSDVRIHLCFLLQNFRVRPPELVFWVPACFLGFFLIISRGKTGWVSHFQPYVSPLASRGWHLTSSTFCAEMLRLTGSLYPTSMNSLNPTAPFPALGKGGPDCDVTKN